MSSRTLSEEFKVEVKAVIFVKYFFIHRSAKGGEFVSAFARRESVMFCCDVGVLKSRPMTALGMLRTTRTADDERRSLGSSWKIRIGADAVIR